MKARIWLMLLVVAVALTAGAWWFSPWWVLHQVRAAAERNDAEAVSNVIDYPRLRESLKTEVNAALTGRIRDGAAGLGEMGRAGATLGAVLAAAVVDKLVETMVRPEFVVRAIRDGQIIIPGRSPTDRGASPGGAAGLAPAGPSTAGGSSAGGAKPGGSSAGTASPAQTETGSQPRFRWRPERASKDRMIVWVSKADPSSKSAAPPATEFGLVFERRGFIDWKLAAVKLPAGLAGSR